MLLVALALACAAKNACDPAQGGIRLVYAVEGGDPGQLRDVLDHRLRALGTACAEVRVAGDEVVVELTGAVDPDVPEVLPRNGHLRIRPTLGGDRAAALKARVPPDATHEQLRAWLSTARPALPADVDALLEPPGSGYPPAVHFVPRDGGMVDPQVVDARVVQSEVGPQVLVTLAEPAASAFSALTAAHVGAPLVIELDGEVLAAPVVRERIDGGAFAIAAGTATADPAAFHRRLAVLLGAPAATGRIELVSESRIGPATVR